ncbi:hypothetical protein H1C71_029404, partial [Ictidomys tridecemlineatus]
MESPDHRQSLGTQEPSINNAITVESSDNMKCIVPVWEPGLSQGQLWMSSHTLVAEGPCLPVDLGRAAADTLPSAPAPAAMLTNRTPSGERSALTRTFSLDPTCHLTDGWNSQAQVVPSTIRPGGFLSPWPSIHSAVPAAVAVSPQQLPSPPRCSEDAQRVVLWVPVSCFLLPFIYVFCAGDGTQGRS